MERVEDGSSMNVVPPMFHAGISNKFTKRHVGNFRDTTLTAASAAKQRAERKLERQADVIEKQQQKIDSEMRKIAEITQNLHRQQLREAKRLRNRLHYAAAKIQAAYRRRLIRINQVKRYAAVRIQTLTRGFIARYSGDPDELRLINQSWTPKKRPHQKPCPVRLSPVVIPSVRAEVNDTCLDVEEAADVFEKEERLRRQEELKQKLQLRRNQEKRQLEYESKLKREVESEASERKLMEREEKAVRLQLKILRRRSKEGKIRKVTADQRREERERLAMTREERHVRLHIKFCARQQNKKRQQLATASSESESQPPSTSSSRREGHARRKSSATKARKTTTGSKKGDASSDEDGDMSFLDIDFTIPASMKSRKQPGNGSSKSKKPVDATIKKKRKGVAGTKSKHCGATGKTPGRGMASMPAQIQAQDHEDDCGYGDEFDDVVDEAALSHLIC
ncbi:hypothetical protein PF002_g289 [Phytophthora fragariae]|uniref:Uncharacterized protein n=1 Tax=Phytophthora fragariae TaxID=53985 RepID=A0A6A4AKA9_9STRA|nr:hypothetical protein PF002_g289 [Phytophthora fragariae]